MVSCIWLHICSKRTYLNITHTQITLTGVFLLLNTTAKCMRPPYEVFDV